MSYGSYGSHTEYLLSVSTLIRGETAQSSAKL